VTRDAAKVRVIAVGIETYKNDALATLMGPARHAVAFAEWATSTGVQPASVWLSCAPAEREKPDPVQEGLDELADKGVTVLDGNLQTLQDLFSSLQKIEGELLLVYWAGHGMLNENDERIVFTADTTTDVNRYLPLKNLEQFLRRYKNFDGQVFFVDACANLNEDVPGRFDSGMFAVKRNLLRKTPQSWVFSAALGAFSNTSETTETTFSGSLLTWLESRTIVDFDVDAAFEHIDMTIKERTTGRTAKGHPVQHRVHTSTRDDDYAYGRSPNQVMWTPRQVHRFSAAAERLGVGVDRLIALMKPVADPGGADDDATVGDLVADVIGQRSRHKLFTALSEGLEPEVAAQLRHEWELNDKVLPFIEPLRTTTLDQRRGLFWRHVPGEEAIPLHLDDALRVAADHGDSNLVNFVVALEQAIGETVPRDAFDTLFDEAELERIRAAPSTKTQPARIVISLPMAHSATWPTQVSIYIRPPGGDFKLVEQVPCEPTEDAVKAVVNEWLVHMSYEVNAEFSVGLIVARKVVEASIPEAWHVESEDRDICGPMWHLWPTCLHMAERRARRGWGDTWDEQVAEVLDDISRNEARIAWIEAGMAAAPRHPGEPPTHCHVLKGRLGPREAGGTSITGSAGVGAAFVFWTHQSPGDWAQTRDLVEHVITHGLFEQTPARLHSKRNQNDPVADNIRMLWDYPSELPPRPVLAAME
jgi:hypothetical protein